MGDPAVPSPPPTAHPLTGPVPLLTAAAAGSAPPGRGSRGPGAGGRRAAAPLRPAPPPGAGQRRESAPRPERAGLGASVTAGASGPAGVPPSGRSPLVFDRPSSLGAAPALKLLPKLKQEKLTEELPEMLFFLPKRTAVLGW